MFSPPTASYLIRRSGLPFPWMPQFEINNLTLFYLFLQFVGPQAFGCFGMGDADPFNTEAALKKSKEKKNYPTCEWKFHSILRSWRFRPMTLTRWRTPWRIFRPVGAASLNILGVSFATWRQKEPGGRNLDVSRLEIHPETRPNSVSTPHTVCKDSPSERVNSFHMYNRG